MGGFAPYVSTGGRGAERFLSDDRVDIPPCADIEGRHAGRRRSSKNAFPTLYCGMRGGGDQIALASNSFYS